MRNKSANQIVDELVPDSQVEKVEEEDEEGEDKDKTARKSWGENDLGLLVNVAVNALSGADFAIDSQLSSTIRNAIKACISRNKVYFQ